MATSTPVSTVMPLAILATALASCAERHAGKGPEGATEVQFRAEIVIDQGQTPSATLTLTLSNPTEANVWAIVAPKGALGETGLLELPVVPAPTTGIQLGARGDTYLFPLERQVLLGSDERGHAGQLLLVKLAWNPFALALQVPAGGDIHLSMESQAPNALQDHRVCVASALVTPGGSSLEAWWDVPLLSDRVVRVGPDAEILERGGSYSQTKTREPLRNLQLLGFACRGEVAPTLREE